MGRKGKKGLCGDPARVGPILRARRSASDTVARGPQVHDHIVLRLAGRWPPPNIQRLEVERGTLLSMVARGFGVTFLGAASQLSPTAGVALLPITDEPEPVVCSRRSGRPTIRAGRSATCSTSRPTWGERQTPHLFHHPNSLNRRRFAPGGLGVSGAEPWGGLEPGGSRSMRLTGGWRRRVADRT